MEKIESNIQLNTLMIQLQGSFTSDAVKGLTGRIVKESSKLSPGYTLLYDFSELELNRDAQEKLQSVIGVLTKYDVGRVIKVRTQTKDIFDIDFDESKSLVYHQIEADSFENAMALI